MAQIVGALGLPHTPVFPMIAEKQGPDGEINRFFARATAEMVKVKPDLIVIFDTDHLNTFFFDSLPIFAIGADDKFRGPIDEVAKVPERDYPSNAAFANHLRRALVHADFDVALAQNYVIDHSIAVPLYFLNPDTDIPVVPIFISGHVPPLPSAQRCYALGEIVGKAIASFPDKLRVLVIGTGSFSLDVCGPLIEEKSTFGVPDPDWSLHVQALMEKGETARLIKESTEAQMLKAGNVGGEVLNWIAMLGAIGGGKAKWMQHQIANGHAYGAWDV